MRPVGAALLIPDVMLLLDIIDEDGLMHIILDRPLIEYYKKTKAFSGIESIKFLCGVCNMSHLCSLLMEKGIPFIFLDIPIYEWNAYKILPEYKGNL